MTQNKEDNLLKFRAGNAKLDKSIYTFSLPSGYTCPGAKDCLARADVETGKITDGPHQKYRCFSATDESRPSVRKARWHNFYLLTACKGVGDMVDLIERSLPETVETVRIHVGGDFFSQSYFDAWLTVARNRPNTIFYAYTKSTPFVQARIDEIALFGNFRITTSLGGKFDHITEELDLTKAHVLFHPEEAEALGLDIDHDDSHAINNVKDFGLLLHGTQPKDTDASAASKRLRDEDVKFSYPSPKNRKTKQKNADTKTVAN